MDIQRVLGPSAPIQSIRPRLSSDADVITSTTLRSSATFTLFQKLPIEIRLKIWKTICYTQRNVDITTGHFYMSNFENCITDYPYFYKSSCPPPIILQVSRESRSEGLKHYKLDFAVKHEMWDSPTPGVTVILQPKIYFNWKVDRLCIVDPFGLADDDYDWDERAERLGRLCRKRKLQYLAFNCEEFIEHEYIFAEIIERAVWLQEIILFNAVFQQDRCRFNVNFNRQCYKCPEGSCTCFANKWKGPIKYNIERLWKKQERKSNEKASERFSSLTWILKGRKGKA